VLICAYTHSLELKSSLPFAARVEKRASLSDAALELIARRFAALAEPTRLRLIHALFDGEKNVRSLVELTGGTQTNISRHLQTLTQAHVLARRKDGLQVFYSIGDPTIFKLCELVCGSLEKQLAKQAGAFAPKR
jgi:ArsR family transcriptional regulator